MSALAATIRVHLAAWIGAATTIAAALAAHLAATRHDRIALSYAGTGDSLQRLIDRLPAEPDTRTAANFVDQAEHILGVQDQEWASFVRVIWRQALDPRCRP